MNTVDKLTPDKGHEPQLVLRNIVLPPGAEWMPPVSGWLLIHVHSGVGYWLGGQAHHELEIGNVVVTRSNQGCVRASQMGELGLHYFRADPRELTGLVTLEDQQQLETIGLDKSLAVLFRNPDPTFSETLRLVAARCEARHRLPVRARLLASFLDILAPYFDRPEPEAEPYQDASDRLRAALSQMPASRLMGISFSELVGQTGCSPRHVSRLFTEMVGVSFREKQVELRLARACELLATTECKVVDVAEQSGYPSISFFNLVFKQHFGVTPAKWRLRANAKSSPKHKRVSRHPGISPRRLTSP